MMHGAETPQPSKAEGAVHPVADAVAADERCDRLRPSTNRATGSEKRENQPANQSRGLASSVANRKGVRASGTRLTQRNAVNALERSCTCGE
jgi:hypothetical protein